MSTTTNAPAATDAPLLEQLRRSAFELCATQRFAPAEALLDAARQLDPRDPEIAADFAALHLHQNRFDAALTWSKAALALDPEHGPASYTQAMALAGSGDLDAARFELMALMRGVRGESFERAYPELSAQCRLALQQLEGAERPQSTRFSAEGAAKYDLGHLTQKANQNVGGPVQDDEALALYALVRVMRVRRVLEVGGLSGYSARNFLAALGDETDAAVYTVDIKAVPRQASNHFVITKDCGLVQPDELHGGPIDLVFFDAHVLAPQLGLLERLERAGLVTPSTVIALHDTNLHPRKTAPWSYPLEVDGQIVGHVHQAVERQMVNQLHERGWDALCLHFGPERGDARLPIRHGLTLMQRFRPLPT